MAALEVYIRRSYQAYDLTQMQHDQVSPIPCDIQNPLCRGLLSQLEIERTCLSSQLSQLFEHIFFPAMTVSDFHTHECLLFVHPSLAHLA